MNTLVDWLLRRFVRSSSEHLPDEKLANLICRELSFLDAWITEHHLAMCRHCRTRRWSLEGPRAQRMIELYGEMSCLETSETLSEQPRADFMQWLQFETHHASLHVHAIRHPRVALSKLRTAMPGISIGLAMGLTIGVIFFLFAWWRVPTITANSLLVHAERWDAQATATGSGVARQVVRIKTAKRSMDRSLYWDLQGKRKARHVTLATNEQQLKLELRDAGVDWERPISASTYQDWHDRQHIRADSIASTGRHLITLTTTVPDGIVSQQSITVRDTDFHPVRRTIGFRDSDTVEIAELDYSVLAWNAVDANVFEPLDAAPLHEMPVLSHAHIVPAVTETRSPEQLDEMELAARFILDKPHTDEDEQVEVRRLEQQVEVNGLVSSDDRKHILAAQLMTVPGLKISIRSEAELRADSRQDPESVTVKATTLPDNPSALETYLRHRGWPLEAVNTLEQQLFEEALIISKESRFLLDLKSRFVHVNEMSAVALATLDELLYSHHERLELALRREQALLAQARAGSLAGAGPLNSSPLVLSVAAERNLTLAKELTQTNVADPRSAEEIFTDMTSTLDRLFPAAREAYADPETNQDMGKRE